MKLITAACVAACLSIAQAQWSFSDAKVAVQGKGAAAGGETTQQSFSPASAVSSPLTLGTTDTLKITLTATESSEGKRPHQAFLVLKDTTTGLSESFPFTVRDTGKAKVDVSQKDIPIQLLTSTRPLKASIVLASFGSSTPLDTTVFDLKVTPDLTRATQTSEKGERYGKLEEIHHIFRADPKSPPIVITLFFTAAAVATLPLLLIGWAALGANLNHLSEAFGAAPLSHGLFFSSILAMEGIFALYYTHWTLFQILPVAILVAPVAYLSGSKALADVQARRLAGKR